jgi:hypothetical protein
LSGGAWYRNRRDAASRERQVILGTICRVSIYVRKLTFLLPPIVVEVDAESAPAATSIENAVLDLFWDRYASGHALSLEIVL